MHGFTCGMDDLILEEVEADKRFQSIENAHLHGIKAAAQYVKLNTEIPQSLKLANRPSYKLNK